MSFSEISGQTLDEKYRIERELGRGGMGTVYLATHLGTERPVAVKVIAPEFMERPEFVERFRREARAAGRLRHPNVVNVTDFGFSDTKDGRVAYLVMEYLDGCTLGEILEEEKNLPVGWTLDILEQVCSAVHEAHGQGIIHRDLKPDNIWLEPNQRGGYTVKVLDFGIAKLEAQPSDESNFENAPVMFSAPTFAQSGRSTLADSSHIGTITEFRPETSVSESATMIQGGPSVEKLTVIMPLIDETNQDATGTRILSDSDLEGKPNNQHNPQSLISTSIDSGLTRVGAVLGTPLYMSPEQCRGEHLDPRSDVYSLGVIAYQMLSGSTPFSGNFTDVMDAHRDTEPPPLNAKKVRKKLKRVISSALAKNPENRPQTAEAFGSILRSRSEGIFGLLRRAGMIYTEHMPKFIGLTMLLYIPFIVVTLLNVGSSLLYLGQDGSTTTIETIVKVGMTLVTVVTGFFCANLVFGTTTWIVNQILSFPLRPVRIRPALLATKANWKKLIGTGLIASTLTLLGYVLCILPGLALSVLLALVSPVVMMENLRGVTAMKRSKALVMRSLRTTTAAVVILFLVPLLVSGAASYVVAVSVKAFSGTEDSGTVINGQTKAGNTESEPTDGSVSDGNDRSEGLEMTVSDGGPIRITTGKNTTTPASRYRSVIRESVTALIMLPFQILLISLSSIIVALLYLKTRQAGGESLSDLLAKFEEADHPRKKWQERVRQRLIQSGRITSKT